MRTIASIAALAASLLTQDPPVPPGGFSVVDHLDQTVVWSDGYVTLMDVFEPSFPAPVGGWPAVLVFHGSGGTRKASDVQAAAQYLAGAGYVTYAYDGRFAGNWAVRNPGWTTPRTQERDLADAAEAHGAAQTLRPGKIDGTRIALTGFSGGGKKSFAGAAWSGLALPVPAAVSHYPTISAIAPEIAPLDSAETAAPGGTLASDHKIADLSPTHPNVQALLAGDYAAFTALTASAFDAQVLSQLQNSVVPAFMMVAAQDNKIINNPSIDAFVSLPAGPPRRMFLSTGGHSSAKNTRERQIQQDMRRRWFDRFLKGEHNGADLEAYAEVAVQPPSNSAHSNLATTWEHRTEAVWPPTTAQTRAFLRANGSLTATAPGGLAVGPTLAHRVAPGFDVASYVAIGGGLSANAVLAQIPKVSTSFLGAPLPAATELIGRGSITVSVDDSTGLFQVTAVLHHVSATGTATWITDGTVGVRSGQAGVHTAVIELQDVAHVIPAGHRLQLTLMNVSDHNPPASRRIRMVPYFTDTDSRILVDANRASYMALPLAPYRSNLSPRLEVASGSSAILYEADLRGSPSRAGLPYALFVGGSGEAPGITLPGGLHAPLNPDDWTTVGAQLQNTPYFPSMVGFLDATGRARPGMTVMPGPVASWLVGQRLTFAAIVLSGPTFESVAGPVTLVIDP